MTDSIARLGFEIDSTPLARAGAEADKAVQKIGAVGDAADKASTRTTRANSAILEAMSRLERQLGGVADKLDRQATAQESLSQSIQQTVRATSGQGAASSELERKLATLEQQLTDVTSANKAASAEARKAVAESKAQTEQAKAQAAAEKRLAEETRAQAEAAKRASEEQKKRTAEQKKAEDAAKKATEESGKMGVAAQALSGRLGGGIPILGALTSGYGMLAASIAGGTLITARAQDQWGQYEARLKNTLGSVTAARAAINDLYATAQGAGTSFDAGLQSFARMAQNANELGATNSEILKLSDTVQKLGIVSGAAQYEVAAGTQQLAQALAAGRLNGDELRSIMENLPALAKAIADGLGVSVGQLRAMGEQGQLTSDKVFSAILKQSDKVQDQFKTLPDTTERSFTRVSDAWSKMLANMGEATNSSGFMQMLLNGTAGLLNLINGSGNTGTKEQGQMRGLESLRANLLKLPGADREGSDTWRRLQTVEAQIKALQPAVQAQRDEAAAAAAAEGYRPAIGVFSRGATAAKGANTLEGSRSELVEQIRTIETALIAAGRRGTPSVLPADQQPTTLQIESMETALSSLRAKLADTTTALQKFGESTADYREALAIGGTGGGLDIVRQAQDLARQTRSQGVGASTGSALGAVIQDRVMRAGESVADLERQTAAQNRLASSVGKTREEIMDAEVAQAAYDFRIKTFGTITTPAIEKAVAAYTEALRKNKQATQDLADAQAFNPMLKQLAQGVADTRAQAGAGSFAALSRLQLEQNIAATTKDMPSGVASQVAAQMRAQYEADIAKSLNGQSLSLQEQIDLQEEQFKFVGLYGAELAVQQTLLQKRVELQREGVDLDGEAARKILEQTEQLARRGAILDQTRTEAENYERIWTDAGASVTGALSASFLALFDKNAKAADVLRQKLSDSFMKMADDLLNTALKPLQDFLTGLLKQAGSYIAGMFGPAPAAANGAVFGGNQANFAHGGVVSSPTMFRFSQGGLQRNGLMGEAGPEAIMPLKRGSDGRLGVAASGASGGGDSIAISISVDASGQQQTQASGDSADNRGQRLGEAISAAVKTEIVNQQRPGGLLYRRA